MDGGAPSVMRELFVLTRGRFYVRDDRLHASISV
jgi:hypothetical protein